MGFIANNFFAPRAPLTAQASFSNSSGNASSGNTAAASAQQPNQPDVSSLLGAQQTSFQPIYFLSPQALYPMSSPIPAQTTSAVPTTTQTSVQTPMTASAMVALMSVMLQMMQMILQLNQGSNSSAEDVLAPGDIPAWTAPTEAIEYGKDASITARQTALIGGLSTEFDSLVGAIQQAAPNSDAMKTAKMNLAQRWSEFQGDPRTLQEFFTLQTIRDQNTRIAALKTRSDSAAKNKVKNLIEARRSVIGGLNKAYAAGQFALPSVDFTKASSIQTRQKSLLGSNDSLLLQMFNLLYKLDPESTTAQSLMSDISNQMALAGNDANTSNKIEEFETLHGINQMNQVSQDLTNLLGQNLYPANSTEAQQIQERIAAIQETHTKAVQRAQHLLAWSTAWNAQ